MADFPFESPFDQWAALQMMADNITSREVALMRRAWEAAQRTETAAPVAWTRHGSAGAEWWSHNGFEARKHRGQWQLSRAGEVLFRDEYLQTVIEHAATLSPSIPAPTGEALSEEEIEQLMARWDYTIHGSMYRYLVRETERAHGIKEKT